MGYVTDIYTVPKVVLTELIFASFNPSKKLYKDLFVKTNLPEIPKALMYSLEK